MGLTPFVGHADQVSVDQAELVAQQFFGIDGRSTKALGKQVPELKLVWTGQTKTGRAVAEAAPTFYVFNRGNNEGFVVIAGDNAVQPVLAYAHEGAFGTEESMPDNLKGWMNFVDTEIAGVRERQTEASAEVKRAWENLGYAEVVVRLVTPWWNQDKPYNTKCPGYPGWGDWRAYTGCTMTATAIVMGYHQWPDQPVGELKGYQTGGLGVWVEGVDLNDHPYRWDKMPEINDNVLPNDQNSAEYKVQEDAISTLMRDLGVMLRANYDFGGTTAMPDMVAARLPRNMKYNENIIYVERKYFTDKGWHRLLTHELDHQRPIVFAGYGKGGGHSFVLDGYDTDGYFSVNWGWGGMSNGFYHIDKMAPGQQGAGGGANGYNGDQEAVIRILPNREGSELEFIEYITFTETMYVEKGLRLSDPAQKIEQGATIEVTAGRYCNLGTQPYQGTLKLVITNAHGDIKKEIYTTPERNLSPGGGTMPLYEIRDKVQVTLDDPIAAGDRIRLVYHSYDGSWKPVVCEDPNAPWEIVLKEGDVAPADVDVKTSAADNLGRRAVATFSAAVPTTPSDAAVEAFYAEEKDEQTIVLKKIEPRGGQLVVPAHTGVVLSTDGEQHFKMVPAEQNDTYVPLNNLLRATGDAEVEVGTGVNAYILSKKSDDILFHKLSQTDRKIGAYRSYLVLPENMKGASVKMLFDDEVTGIENMEVKADADAAIYDLSGRKVHRVVKGGIYIKNGKKFIVR